MPFPSDQLRCSLVQEKDNSINYVLSRLDGTIVNEIDIGQEDWQYHWPENKKFFDWKFIDHTPDMRFKEQLTTFQEAFNSVQKLTQIKIDFARDFSKKTDITVEWLEDIQSFDNKLGVLAHAYFYFPNSSKNGVMEFNDSPNSNWYFTPLGWPVEAYLVDPLHFYPGQKDANGNLIMRASQPTLQIAMHELGHILFGRHDIKNQKSLMFPYVKPGYIGDTLQKEAFYWDNITSIPRMQKYFGKSNILDSSLARWQQRRVLRSLYKRN